MVGILIGWLMFTVVSLIFVASGYYSWKTGVYHHSIKHKVVLTALGRDSGPIRGKKAKGYGMLMMIAGAITFVLCQLISCGGIALKLSTSNGFGRPGFSSMGTRRPGMNRSRNNGWKRVENPSQLPPGHGEYNGSRQSQFENDSNDDSFDQFEAELEAQVDEMQKEAEEHHREMERRMRNQ